MGRLTVPALVAGATDDPLTAVRPAGRLTHDVVRARLAVHDGATPGGVPLAKKSETDALEAGKATNAALNALTAVVGGKASQAEVDELSDQVAAIEVGDAGGLLGAATWAILAAYATGDFVVGQLAEVLTDAGVHVDPVNAAVGVSNSGRFRWSAAPAGWERIGDTAYLSTIAAAEAAANRIPGAFLSSATDEYIKTVVTDIKVEQGEGDTYFLNYETVYYAGIPLWRVKFRLWSVALGAVVASSDFQGTYDPTVAGIGRPDTVFLTQVADGATQPGYAGVLATLTINWDAVVWTEELTTYVTTAEAGIDPRNTVSNGQMDEFLERSDPKAIRLIKAVGGDFTTLAAATVADWMPDLNVTRSTFPMSDVSTPTHQALYEIIDPAHAEEIVPVTIFGIDNGLRVPHYSTVRFLSGGRLYMEPGSGAPVLECNFPCRIEGPGVLEQEGNGYVIHIDAENGLTKAGAAPFLRHRHRHVIKDMTLKHHGTDSTAAMIGMGVSDGSTLILDGVNFVRMNLAGTAPLVIIHTSPACVVPSLIVFRNCYFNDALIVGGGVGIQLLKSHNMTVQHRVVIENTEIAVVQNDTGVGIDPPSGFIRQGRFDPSITYDATMDPTF